MQNGDGTLWSNFFYFLVRTIKLFRFSHMFIMASFDRENMFSILWFIGGLYAKVGT